MPFLQALPSAFSVPLPIIVSDAPALTFIAAPSKASATVSSVDVSFAGSSLSVIVLSPSKMIIASAVLLIDIGADVDEVSVRLSRISTTSVVPFFTLIVPSTHSPLMTYVPDALIVRSVPSIV